MHRIGDAVHAWWHADCEAGRGGASRDRTGDLLLAKQALSQLSYGPGEGAIVFLKRRTSWLEHTLDKRVL